MAHTVRAARKQAVPLAPTGSYKVVPIEEALFGNIDLLESFGCSP